MRRILPPLALAVLLVAACVPVTPVQAPAPPVTAEAPTVTVYKSPT